MLGGKGSRSDYKAFGMDVGYRQFFGTAKARPNVGVGGGFVRVDAIQSEFSVPAAGVVLSNVNMYDTSVVPSIGAGGGVQINLSDRFAVQGGVEFKWKGDAEDFEGLAGTGTRSPDRCDAIHRQPPASRARGRRMHGAVPRASARARQSGSPRPSSARAASRTLCTA
jgi:hypothetical protein